MDRVMSMLKTKYATFDGRARRKEYWYFTLFFVLCMIAASIIDGILFGLDDDGGPVQLLVIVGLIVPAIAVGFRRLHDIDRSAWWMLISLIPIIGALVMLYWTVQPGTVGPNRFGPDPLAEEPALNPIVN